MAVLTPIKAIRAKCMDCCAGQFIEIRLCTISSCPLYPYRMGHRPKGEEVITEKAEIEKSEASPVFFNIEDGIWRPRE